MNTRRVVVAAAVAILALGTAAFGEIIEPRKYVYKNAWVRADNCATHNIVDASPSPPSADADGWIPESHQIVQSSRSWCEDSLTVCWNPCKSGFSGLRFIAEPRLGNIIEWGKKNRPELEAFGGLTLLGVETNWRGGYIALQAQVVLPGTVTLDEHSPLRKEGRVVGPDGTPVPNGSIHVDSGFGIGFSFFDGVLAAGFGMLRYDSRLIRDMREGEDHNMYLYVNFQPISSLRAGLKHIK